MNRLLNLLSIVALLSLMIACCSKECPPAKTEPIPVEMQTIAELDETAAFNFTIMSDNKGDSPASKPEFARMVKWIEESRSAFVIGLGDHVKRGWRNDFLEFLDENAWWKQNFYPNVADGENEFYGKNQGDWGAGAPILDTVDLSTQSNTTIRKNGCEYYSKINVAGYTVHLIQLHYSDQPRDEAIAFTKDSRQYLIDTLRSIEKGEKDIVIAAAHTRTGFWINQLSDEERPVVMDKCDLVLSATTHFFERKIIPEYENSGPLFINTGSITYPSRYCPPGYVHVHVLENPTRLIVQYINASRPQREMQHDEYAFEKVIGGRITSADFRKPRPEENMDREVGFLSRDYSKDEMTEIAKKIYLDVTGADEAYITAGAGLKSGKVTYRQLWDLFPYNNEIYALTLTADQVRSIFKDRVAMQDRSELKLAINGYNGDYIVKKLSLDEARVVKTGKREVELLQEWIEGQVCDLGVG
ncbi:5'-nucleotidase C-terminal domain-containing protein [bacterium]|nr:5'-nucleotidase C-terminal domain-containing protein [bacterium]